MSRSTEASKGTPASKLYERVTHKQCTINLTYLFILNFKSKQPFWVKVQKNTLDIVPLKYYILYDYPLKYKVHKEQDRQVQTINKATLI